MTKTWCVGGTLLSNNNFKTQYEKLNPRTKKLVKIIKTKCDVCISDFLLIIVVDALLASSEENYVHLDPRIPGLPEQSLPFVFVKVHFWPLVAGGRKLWVHRWFSVCEMTI